jgi:hypothetical protein
MSLSLASCAEAICLSASSGSDRPANPRSPVIRRARPEGQSLARRGPDRALGRAEHADERAHDIGQVAHHLDVLAGIVAQPGGGEFEQPRMLGSAGAARPAQGRRPRRQVEQHLRHHHAGLAVQHGVVGLDVVPDLAALQALDHVQAP